MCRRSELSGECVTSRGGQTASPVGDAFGDCVTSIEGREGVRKTAADDTVRRATTGSTGSVLSLALSWPEATITSSSSSTTRKRIRVKTRRGRKGLRRLSLIAVRMRVVGRRWTEETERRLVGVQRACIRGMGDGWSEGRRRVADGRRWCFGGGRGSHIGQCF